MKMFFAMLTSTVLCTSLAAQWPSKGTGIETDPFIIETPADFYDFALAAQLDDFAGEFIRLDTNIAIPGLLLPPGPVTVPFAGTFDGNQMTVSNWRCDISLTGLFGYTTDSSVIKNLVVDSFQVISAGPAGCIAAVNHGLIESCRVINSTLSNANATSYTGGVVGENYGTVKYCLFEAPGPNSIVSLGFSGGLVGKNEGSILNSKTTPKADVDAYPALYKDANTAVIGGFVGLNTGSAFIDNCWSDLVPNTTNGTAGGFAGRTSGNSYITNSISAGIMPAGVGQGHYAGFIGNALSSATGKNNFVPNDINAQSFERGNYTGHIQIIERTRAYLNSTEFVIECNFGGGNWGLDKNGNITPAGLGETVYVPYSFLKGDFLNFFAVKDFNLDSFYYVKKIYGEYNDPWKKDKTGKPVLKKVMMPLKKYVKTAPVIDSGYLIVTKHISVINKPTLKTALKTKPFYFDVLAADATKMDVQKDSVKVYMRAVLPGKKIYTTKYTTRYAVPPRINKWMIVDNAYAVVRAYDGGLSPKSYLQLEIDGKVLTKPMGLVKIGSKSYNTLPQSVKDAVISLVKENDPENVTVQVFKFNGFGLKNYPAATRADIVLYNLLGYAAEKVK